jgi:hypothetical protein
VSVQASVLDLFEELPDPGDQRRKREASAGLFD